MAGKGNANDEPRCLRGPNRIVNCFLAAPVQRDFRFPIEWSWFPLRTEFHFDLRKARSLMNEFFDGGSEAQCVENARIKHPREVADFIQHYADVLASLR